MKILRNLLILAALATSVFMTKVQADSCSSSGGASANCTTGKCGCTGCGLFGIHTCCSCS